MYDIEALAIRIANRARDMLRMYQVFEVEDKFINNLASAGQYVKQVEFFATEIDPTMM